MSASWRIGNATEFPASASKSLGKRLPVGSPGNPACGKLDIPIVTRQTQARAVDAMPPSKHCLWPEMPPLRKQVRRWFWRWRLPRDPWERLEAPVDFRELAAGAGADFRDYFKGACLVEPADLAELCEWLHACQFVTDERQFGKSEHWQHPVEFEQRRCGDCEDHALWAWRKLAEMGMAVEFVVGLHDPQPNHCWCNHAWLHVQAGPRLLLLETTAARREGMLMDLESARHCYLPTASIDHRFRTCCFANYYHVRATGKAMKLR